MIHPTAVIHPKACIDATVRVGPCAVIDEEVTVGPHCVIGPHVYLTGLTRLGSHNRIHAGSVLGEAPQDLKYGGEPTGLIVGDHNVFREHVTIHRSNSPGEPTTVGNHNLFMAHSHAGHNSRIGNHVILANGALLGGHAEIQDRAFISGHCLVHQFVRVGTMVMMQGGAAVSKDVPPYTIATGINMVCGLNSVGLRRAGVSSQQRLELRKIYHALFRSGISRQASLADAEAIASNPLSAALVEFVRASRRGVCCDSSQRQAGEDDASAD